MPGKLLNKDGEMTAEDLPQKTRYLTDNILEIENKTLAKPVDICFNILSNIIPHYGRSHNEFKES